MNSKYQLVSEAISGYAAKGAAAGATLGGAVSLMTYGGKVKKLQRAIEKEKDPEIKTALRNKLVSLIKGGRTMHALKGAGKGAAVFGTIGAARGLSKSLNAKKAATKYILPN
jgi:hypothetical protein